MSTGPQHHVPHGIPQDINPQHDSPGPGTPEHEPGPHAGAESGSDSGGRGPLSGVLVADFSRVLAGPLTTMWLADLGATVVKVERTGSGDETRGWGPPWAGDTSSYFTAANRSKLSLDLDLNAAEDVALAQQLAGRADVMVENFRVGSLARFGLDYESVAAANPGVVYASISGFGTAEGASLPGYDFIVQAVGGLMSITGQPEGEPTKVGVALVDVLTAKDAAIAILAALRARDQGHGGQHVQVNLLSTLLGSLANQASSYLTTGNSPTPMGNQHPSIAPYETLRCRDGLLAVACGNNGQFQRLCNVLGIPEVAADPRFETNAARVTNRADLVAALEEQLSHRDASEWETMLQGADVPAGQVASIEAAFARAAELGLRPTTDLPGGHPPQVAHPISYPTTRPRPATAPPGLGQHSDQVRTWLRDGAPLDDLETMLDSRDD